MKLNYGLEMLITGLKKQEEKLLPAFRRLVDEGVVSITDVLKCRDMGNKGAICAFELIGYELKDVGRKPFLEKGESKWF